MRVLVLCAATFVVGLLAGPVLWPDHAQSRTTQGLRARDGDRRDGTSVYSPDDVAGDDRGAGSSGGSQRKDLRTLKHEASRVIDRITENEDAQAVLTGDGTISGTVRDPSGNPVAGVAVTAIPETQPFDLSFARREARMRPHENRDLQDVAREAIEAELWRRHARHTAMTGANGRFELEGLMDGRHVVTAFHKDYDVQPLSQRGRVEPDAVLDFQARPVVEVKVEVHMPDGSMADNAWLRWQGPHGNGNGAWMKEKDTVRLPLGTIRVKAQTWRPEPMESAEVEHIVEKSSAARPLVLPLEARRLLVAKLVMQDGLVLPRNVEYRMRRLVDNEEIDPKSLLQDQSQRYARSNSPGRAHWVDLEAGSYLVAAFLDKRRLIAHAVAEVGAGVAEVDLPVDISELGDTITVKLLGPDGGPVPGQVSFRIVLKQQGKSRTHRIDALQRDDGAWLAFVEGVEGDEPTMRVGTRDYGGAQQPIRLRGGATVTFRFDKAARLKLSIERYGGSAVKGSVYAALRGELGADAWRLVSPDGSADLRGVQPGTYHLNLYVRKKGRNHPIFQRRVTLREGEEEMSIPMPGLHTLRVRWNGRGRPRVVVRSRDDRIGSLRLDARLSGKVATFEALAAGAYSIECGGKKLTVQVPAGGEVTLE